MDYKLRNLLNSAAFTGKVEKLKAQQGNKPGTELPILEFETQVRGHIKAFDEAREARDKKALVIGARDLSDDAAYDVLSEEVAEQVEATREAIQTNAACAVAYKIIGQYNVG
ncbi:MAG: hypothetical protein CMH26_07160 [Micavibrio sp.]|nr:hypothetical protein [Micavibrio sp.]|tara:strand:- start:126 stop:461 length:336 start_codon:yes stop_codon:yes gene_type:complete